MVKPLLDYILIQPISEEKTNAGIYRPESSKERPTKGKVLSVGPSEPIEGITDGDIVYFKKYNANELERNMWAVQAKDVIAVIKEN